MIVMFRRLFHGKQGASAIEYALVASFIGVAVAAIVATVGSDLSDTFATAAESL